MKTKKYNRQQIIRKLNIHFATLKTVIRFKPAQYTASIEITIKDPFVDGYCDFRGSKKMFVQIEKCLVKLGIEQKNICYNNTMRSFFCMDSDGQIIQDKNPNNG